MAKPFRMKKAERSIPASKRKLLLVKLKHDKLIEEFIKLKQIDEGEIEPEKLKAHWALIDSLGERIYKLHRQQKMLESEVKLETEPSERLKKKVLLRRLRLKTRFKEKAQFNEFILKKTKEIDLENFIPRKAKELTRRYSPEETQARLAMAAHAKIIDALGMPKNKAEILKKTWALSFLVTKGIKLIPLPLTTHEHAFGVVGRTIEVQVTAEIMSRAINHALYAVGILSHEEIKKGPKQIKEPKIIGGQKFLVPSASQIYLEKLSSYEKNLKNKLKEVNKLKPSTEVQVSLKDAELFLDVFAGLTWHYCLNDRKLGALNWALSDIYKSMTDKLFS